MLSRIFIQNFALIDTLEIKLGDKMQVITGETGAGKSIILGALRLILGERADVKSIANQDKKSIVEAEFKIGNSLKSFFDQNDLDFEPSTIIRREILPSGKSRAFINDVPTTLQTLKKLSDQLIDIHSQFETSDLLNENFQFQLVDGLAKNQELLSQYQSCFSQFNEAKNLLKKSQDKLSNGKKEADYQQFLLTELEEASLEEVDLEELQGQLSTLENAEEIIENLAQIFSLNNQEEVGIHDTLFRVNQQLRKIAEKSAEFQNLSERLESNFVELKDIIAELEDKAGDIEQNPEELHFLNTKFNLINQLLNKHQVNTIDELIEIRDKIASEQGDFLELEEKIKNLEEKINALTTKLTQLSNQLSQRRKKVIPDFKTELEKLFKQLGLEKAKTEIQLTDSPTFHSLGKEHIKLLFQANSGFPLKPIQEAISGGERSRVMLAVKKMLADHIGLPTLILDEIDTGVSGKIADEMGNLMKEMAKNRQLLVISHLAQVAAKGNKHYKVIKEDINGKTQSNIIELTDEERLNEIAQLLSGKDITKAALEQAKMLMRK